MSIGMERNLSELKNAEIVPNAGGENAWMVRFGENDYDTVNKTPKNRLILEEGVLDLDYTLGDVRVEVDLENDDYRLSKGGRSVKVPSSKEEHVLWTLYDQDVDRARRLFRELTEDRVRVGLMDWFMPRFSEARENNNLRKVEDGWLVNEEILVAWDGENYCTNLDETHVVQGGSTVTADEEKPARDIDFGTIPHDASVEAPSGKEVTLSKAELKFLATVEFLTENDGPSDDIGSLVEKARVNSFTDTKSGLHHGHSMDKHTLDMLGVTDEAAEKLYYNSYDHAGVHEMSFRRQEFENSPINVFEDAANDDTQKWQKIESTTEKAPIPRDVRQSLKSMYGGTHGNDAHAAMYDLS